MGAFLNHLSERWTVSLVGIALVGFALRSLWTLGIPVEPISDSVAYDTFARNIVEHGVYGWSVDEPGAYWAVGASGLLAGIYWVFGIGNYAAVAAVNVLISASLIVSTGLLARHLLGAAGGLLAAAMIALWPSLIMFTSIIASEVTFLALVVPGTYAYLRHREWPWTGLLVAGLFWGAACYIRPVVLLLPIVLAASYLLRGHWNLWQGVVAIIGTGIVMALLIAPWTVRNQAVFGKTVLISTNFGPNLWMGNNPDTTGAYQTLPDWVTGLSETERADRMKEEAIAYIKAEPMAFATRTLVKFFRLHERETIGVVWNEPALERIAGKTTITALKVLATGYWFAVLLGALAGVVWIVRHKGLWQLLIHPAFLCWMYFAWVHAIIVIGDRYHFPVIPFVAILAASAITRWLPPATRQRPA